MAKKYWGLLVYDPDYNQWSWEYGSKERQDVISERQYYRDTGIKAKHMTILSYPHIPSQREVDTVMQTVNAIQSKVS
jgi:hypothetical protein